MREAYILSYLYIAFHHPQNLINSPLNVSGALTGSILPMSGFIVFLSVWARSASKATSYVGGGGWDGDGAVPLSFPPAGFFGGPFPFTSTLLELVGSKSWCVWNSRSVPSVKGGMSFNWAVVNLFLFPFSCSFFSPISGVTEDLSDMAIFATPNPLLIHFSCFGGRVFSRICGTACTHSSFVTSLILSCCSSMFWKAVWVAFWVAAFRTIGWWLGLLWSSVFQLLWLSNWLSNW